MMGMLVLESDEVDAPVHLGHGLGMVVFWENYLNIY